MPIQGQRSSHLRLLRLIAALSLAFALLAVATIANGDSAAKSAALVILAIGLGSIALLGQAVAALPYLRRKKDQDDHRS